MIRRKSMQMAEEAFTIITFKWKALVDIAYGAFHYLA
jgi:hypothetical protein